MLVTENKIIRHHKYKHTYSDTYYIRSLDDGQIYYDAYDPYSSDRTYEETDILLEEES